MSGKLFRPRLAFFLLALGSGSACVAAELPKFVNMAETLNREWNERLLEKLLQAPAPNFTEGCGGVRLHPIICGGCYFGGRAILLDPPTSKYRFSDPRSPFLDAFRYSTRVKITSIEPSLILPPHLASALCDRLYEGYRILNRTSTSDTFASLHCFKLMMSILSPDEALWVEPAESLEMEVESYRPSHVPPSIIIEYEGKHWLRVEIFIEARIAVVRTQDKWGGCSFTPADASCLQASINDLHAIYANQSAEE